MLINAYVERRLIAGSAGTSRTSIPAPTPGAGSPDDAFPPEVETHLVNAVLTNGARYYVDHAHPEISTPECVDASGDRAVRPGRRGDRAAFDGARRRRRCPPAAEIVVYKNNSDGKGNSYGCHENYLVDRAVPFGRIVAQITPHFVTRQVFCGAGKVGCELPGVGAGDVPFQISQRADFFEEEVGLETTLKRPIVNTRDEPHCDSQKYRRLHVIVGDANLSEVATFLKVGTTAIVLAMIEDDGRGRRSRAGQAGAGHQGVSARTRRSQHAPAARDGTQAHGPRHAVAAASSRPRSTSAGARAWPPWAKRSAPTCSALGGGARPALELDPMSLVDAARLGRQVPAGRRLSASVTACTWGDARLRAIDLQYHDMRPEQSLFARVGHGDARSTTTRSSRP